MTEAAKFGTGDLVISNFRGREVHVNDQAGDSVLLEAERRNKEAVNHVDRPQSQIHFTIDRQVHDTADEIVFRCSVIRIQANGAFVSGGRINQFGLGSAELAVGAGVAEVPGELHAGDFDGHRSGLGRLKTLGGPDGAAHEIEAYKEDSRQGSPKYFELGVAMGVDDLAAASGLAILPDEVSESALGKNEDNAHQQVGDGKLAIDAGSCRGNPLGQPPGLGGKEVGANEGDQPNYAEKREAHPLACS